MASEVRAFSVTVPAGTPVTAPQVTNLTMPARLVRRVRVRVPPGPAGLVGWALGSAGQRVVPWGDQQWLVMDNETVEWELENQITSGAWQLQAYNSGVYDHTVYVTFLVDPPQAKVGAGVLFSPLELAP